MGLSDAHDVLGVIDRWVVTGEDEALLARCFAEQCWIWGRRTELRRAWADSLGDCADSRGVGWRVWYLDGRVLTSRDLPWRELPDGIVLGVGYDIETRWMLQGMDPYWLNEATGRPSDNRWKTVPPDLDPALGKMGVWVTDAEMGQFRWQAALAMTLDHA